jgi:hypothetical protein
MRLETTNVYCCEKSTKLQRTVESVKTSSNCGSFINEYTDTNFHCGQLVSHLEYI